MNYPGRTQADRVYDHLGEIIDGLRARGYTFKTMNDVIAASRKRLVFNTSIVERP
jgi:hypothetical protein